MKITTLLILGLVVTSCGEGGGDDTASVKTNLGASGNTKVKDEFTGYVTKSEGAGCGVPNAESTDKRVIVTGFGLFSGADYNISGKVVESMATGFWSADVTGTTSAAPAEASIEPSDGGIAASEAGGQTRRRKIRVDGKTYDVCFIVLDVKWDLASAIIVHEMDRFKPAMVLMSGRGGEESTLVFEGGALNSASTYNGFASGGEALGTANAPVAAGERILPDKLPANGKPDHVAMTWDNATLATVAEKAVKSVGYTVEREPAGRLDNNYICNNVSYVVLYGARGDELRLAGGNLVLKLATPAPATKIGFLHLPYDYGSNTTAKVTALATVYAAAIRAQLD